MTNIVNRLRQLHCWSDALIILALVGFSLWLMRFLFSWGSQILASDLSGAWAWFYWLKESLFTFHQLPTWSPLWTGGMPFFGMVPSAGYFFILPFYLVTRDIPAAYNLATIVMFSLAGAAMYVYLKHLTTSRLVAFLGALLYVILPVHTCSMVLWGHFEIVCTYAIVPFVLLFTDRFLDGAGQTSLVLLGLLVSFVLLLQIEYALIFLLFYISYLVFALAIRRRGWRSMIETVRRNKLGFVICLLVLLIPLSFYLTVVFQYDRFSSLTREQVEGGLPLYTLKHFSDPFQARLPGDLGSFFEMPRTECYSGGISFVILLAAAASVVLDKEGRRAHMLFFLLAGLASLILSMGIYGPLFPVVRKIIPFLSGMRVPLRFYYVFALCLPVLFALALLSFRSLAAGVPALSAGRRRLLFHGVPVLLVIIMIVDVSPYFDFYRHRVLDREQYNKVASFIEERIKQDSHPGDGPARVLVVPDGVDPDRMAVFETGDDGQFVIEMSQSWLTWDQYRGASAFDSAVLGRILVDTHNLDFYSDLLSYDYVLRWEHKLAPAALDSTYLDLIDQLEEKVDVLCADESQILLDKGSLDTDYYCARLYRINKAVLAEARFHPSDDTLFIVSSDLYASNTLFEIYDVLGGPLAPGAFLQKVAAVAAEEGLPDSVAYGALDIGGLCRYEGEILLLPDDPLAGQVLQSGNCEASGWERCERKESLGFPDSGLDMAAPGLGAAGDNYLAIPFAVEQAGSWILNLDYFSDTDGGTLQVFVDGHPVATVDTYDPGPSMKGQSVYLTLDAGQHELRLTGREKPLAASAGDAANRVEVGRISLLNPARLPQLQSRSQALWDRITGALANDGASAQVSGFTLSSTGISLDVDAAASGVVSVAYYNNPWWKVYVDGQETALLVVDGVFPGCCIESGRHHVEFVCHYPALSNLFGLGR